jgi:transcriptional regulator with XRE-family HTH domain
MRRLIGFRVRELRARAGLTQADLAGRELSRAGVAKIEAGASLPSLAALEHLARVLGVRPRALIPRVL